MQLQRGRVRQPRSLDDLTPLEQAQLAVAGERYDGEALPAAARISHPDAVADVIQFGLTCPDPALAAALAAAGLGG